MIWSFFPVGKIWIHPYIDLKNLVEEIVVIEKCYCTFNIHSVTLCVNEQWFLGPVWDWGGFMGFILSPVLTRLGMTGPDEVSVDAITLFVVLLSACIVIGHLLEKNRWMTESISALLIVSFSTLYTVGFICSIIVRYMFVIIHTLCRIMQLCPFLF